MRYGFEMVSVITVKELPSLGLGRFMTMSLSGYVGISPTCGRFHSWKRGPKSK